ncbi:hypothetical protein EV1_027868 [Malus domestica]
MRLRSPTVFALPVLFLCFFATVPTESLPKPETSPPGSLKTHSKPLVLPKLLLSWVLILFENRVFVQNLLHFRGLPVIRVFLAFPEEPLQHLGVVSGIFRLGFKWVFRVRFRGAVEEVGKAEEGEIGRGLGGGGVVEE